MDEEEASANRSHSPHHHHHQQSEEQPERVIAETDLRNSRQVALVTESSLTTENVASTTAEVPVPSARRKVSYGRWLARRFSEEQEEDVLSYYQGIVPDPVPFSRNESVEEVHGQQQRPKYPRLEEICMEEFPSCVGKPMVPPRRRRVTAATLPPEAGLLQSMADAQEPPFLRRVRSATCFRGQSDHGSRDWWYENGFAGMTCDYCRSGHVPYEPCPSGMGAMAATSASVAARDEPYGRYSWAPSAHASEFLMPSRSQTPNILQIPTEGGPMVLQLVLPRSSNTNVADDVRSGRDLREQALTSVVSSSGLNGDGGGDATRNQQLGAMDKDKDAHVEGGLGLGMGLYSAAQVAASPASASVSGAAVHAPAPTSDKERAEIFKKNLTTMLSCIYALFILMLGCVVYVADLLQPGLPVAEVFTMYLTLIGTTWLIFLHFDIRKFLTSVRLWRRSLNQDNLDRLGKDNRGFEGGQFSDVGGSHQPRVAPKSPTQTPRFDAYCFKTGRHSGSFYLKIGAAGFCFGHLIHEGLLLSRQILYFSSNEAFRAQCADSFTLLLNIIHPVFSFYQLFIVFKYSNIVINRNKEMSRFAVMHIIAANLCFWVNTIIRETVEALQQKAAHHHEMSTPAPTSPSTTPVLGFLRADRFGSREHEDDDDDDDDDDSFFFRAQSLQFPFQSHNSTPSVNIAHHTDVGKTILDGFLNSTRSSLSDVCVSRTVLSSFTIQAAPYLYPFTIEYSLLMAGIWFIIWYNIGNVDQDETEQATTDAAAGTSAAASSSSSPEYGHHLPENFSPGNMVIHVDCHSSNRGLFAGLLILLATVVSVIVFFVAMTNTEYIHTGIIINNVSDTVLELLMVISVVLAYRQTARLDFNKHAVTFLDDILLFIALPCFFLLAIFNVVAGIAASGSTFSIVISALSVIQVTLQTPFIIDGLRRCSNSYSLRCRKPGRELITFLVVCNLAAWILETFEIKSFDTQKDRIEYYGIFLWTLLSHATVPLTLFYRFHSSVCLVDMWKSAYEAGEAE